VRDVADGRAAPLNRFTPAESENHMLNRRELLQGVTGGVGTGLISSTVPSAQSSNPSSMIFVDAERGRDTEPGTRARPLKALAAAARLVNSGVGPGSVSVLLAPGVYPVDETAVLNPVSRSFTRKDRLTLRAEVLPDDPAWTPGHMPVLVHTLPLRTDWMGRPDPFGGVAYGIQVETSHVTIQGLRFLGQAHLERPAATAIHRVYPIAREDAALDDLEITQCLFAGEKDLMPMHCAILARGNGVVVDRSVFYNCKISVVYWTPGATGCAMRHTLVHGSYVTAPWLCSIGEDFDFRGNVISGSLSAVLFQGEVRKYVLAESLFAGNQHLYGAGGGPAVNFKALPPATLPLPPSSRTAADSVRIDLDQSKKRFLHVMDRTPGSEVPCGLFGRE
jgi:hypothetical protein